MREFRVSDAQREFLHRRIRQTRRDFATTVLAMLLRGRKIDLGYVMRFFRNDPALLGEIPVSALRTLPRVRPGQG